MDSRPHFDLCQDRLLARCETHVAGEDELAAHAPDPPSDLRDADDRRLGETDERIHQDRQAGRSGGCDEAEVSRRVDQIEVGKVKLGVRALEYDDPKARVRVHSSEQILEVFEYPGADNVERRVVEDNLPVRSRLFDDAQVRSGCSHDSCSSRASRATSRCRKQVTTWSLTIPTACMCA